MNLEFFENFSFDHPGAPHQIENVIFGVPRGSCSGLGFFREERYFFPSMEETREEMGLNREEMEETGKKGKKLYFLCTLTIIMHYCHVYGPLFAFFNAY